MLPSRENIAPSVMVHRLSLDSITSKIIKAKTEEAKLIVAAVQNLMARLIEVSCRTAHVKYRNFLTLPGLQDSAEGGSLNSQNLLLLQLLAALCCISAS